MVHRSTKIRRSQKYEADLTKYNEKEQEVIKRAVESGILNNTNRTHEFVDLIAKISADKGILFDFTNNQRLKESGLALNGKTINGFVRGGNVTLNIDSAKSLNKVVGHEITHVLEGTGIYETLQNIIKEYATTKGEYDTRLAEITELYKDVEDADFEKELTADLIGDYLFTDEKFVQNLLHQKQDIFHHMWNEVKYFCKTVTAGTKEAKQLLEVQRTFEKVWKKGTVKRDENIRHSISENFYNQINSWDGKTTGFSFVVGTTSDALMKAGIPDQQIRWDASKIKTTIEKHNGMSMEVIKQVPKLLENPVVVIDSKQDAQSKIIMGELRDVNGKIVTVVLKLNPTSKKGNQLDIIKISSSQGRGHIESLFKYENGESVKIRYVDEKRIQDWLNVNRLQLPLHSFNLDSNNSISQNSENATGNKKFSLTEDNQGRKLSKGQQDYFKDSKVRDTEGNLLVVYHGTPEGGFTVFDPSRSYIADRPSVANWFSPNKEMINKYYNVDNSLTPGRKQLYEVYLKIENPLVIDAKGEAWNEIPLPEELRGKGIHRYYNPMIQQYVETKDASTENLAKYAYKNGYDGLIIKNVKDGSVNEKPSDVYATFNSNQVKMITNENPTDNQDINLSLSDSDSDIAPLPGWDVKGSDIAFDDLPIRSDAGQGMMKENMRAIAKMESVCDVPEEKLRKTGKRPSELYQEFFDSIGNVIPSEKYGDIALGKASVKSEIRHGITAEKLASIEAIPSVIEKGKVIFDKEKHAGVRRIVICAPIKIGVKPYYMGVMLQKDAQHQRLYLHNVVIQEEMASSEVDLLTDKDFEENDHLLISSILQKALQVKYKEELQSAEDTTPAAELEEDTDMDDMAAEDIVNEKIANLQKELDDVRDIREKASVRAQEEIDELQAKYVERPTKNGASFN